VGLAVGRSMAKKRDLLRTSFILLLVLISQVNAIWAQTTGRFPVMNFHHREYNGHAQSWAITQDNRGLIYIANNVGVIEYDGSEWRHISINGALARCLDTDKNGRIWVGGQDEFGYLAADSTNTLSFHSLSQHIPETAKPLGMIRQLYASDSSIYFSSFTTLFRLNKDLTVSEWSPKTQFHRSYLTDGVLFIHQRDYGLCYLSNDSLRLVPGGDYFAPQLIYAILPFNQKYFLICTQNDGFYLLSRQALDPNFTGYTKPAIVKFSTSDDNFFASSKVYAGLKLDDNTFAISTYSGGVVFIDTTGNITRRIDTSVGLQDNTAWYLYMDNQKNLWIALNNGISYTPIFSQLTSWTENDGIKGVLQSVVRFKNHIYFTTNVGIFWFSNGRIEQVTGLSDLSWKLRTIHTMNGDEALLATTSSGIFQVEGGKATLIENGKYHSYCLLQSKLYPKITYVGLREGVGVIAENNGRFKFLGELTGTKGEVYSLAEDLNGDLWYSERYKGINYVDMVNPYQLVSEKPILYTLPFNPRYDDIAVVMIDGEVKASAECGLSKFSHQSNMFEPDSSLGLEFANGTTGLRILNQDKNGNIWFEAYNFSANRWLERAVKYPKNIYRREPAQFRTIPETIFYDIFPEDNNKVVWIACTDGLFRFDEDAGNLKNPIFRVLIRQVSAGPDHILFNGVYYDGNEGITFPTSLPYNEVKSTTLPYRNNSLTFTYSAPFFGQQQKLLYSYMLVGFDKTWSDWQPNQRKEYTNLPFGTYQFNVKAKNLFNIESPAETFQFTIQKPLYLQWWAITGYVVALLLIIWLSIRINTQLLRNSNIKLQQLVDERTLELSKSEQALIEKNVELQRQKEEILTQRDELEEHNRHINDSIIYAQTIQQAILPDLSQSLGNIFEHFLIYKPKELVSGDFYWISHAGPKSNPNEKIFIAVVDCTGHGVPGAFMSLIGSRLLSEIVNEKKIYNPADILTELSASIKVALHQNVSESFDGMDIALCLIESKPNDMFSVTFAGANRPIFCYSKAENRIQTLKGNRKSIGGLLPDVDLEFTNWRVPMHKGDMIIMYTDGLTDQNNSSKRKFTTARFQTYLLANIEKPMEEISSVLLQEFNEFTGSEPQRDDITILGIRL
jgi:serine phosphatase RsbU (regulator of sigma subunit)/ligand-binding sensor domain-containing protein